ncbi:MAG: hypothetical protein RLZZ200_2573 [Pseudomonadota bacterium]
MNRRRILLVAYQCGPGMGSVSQIGWEWYSRLSQSHEVTLVTHVRNREALLAANAPLGSSEIQYVDSEWFDGPLYRFARWLFPRSEHSVFLVSSLDYFVFDAMAYRALRRRMRQGQSWDALHRVTPVTLAAATWLPRLGLPTVIGPLNSGLTDPKGFGKVMREESTWLISLRRLGQWFDKLIGSLRLADRVLVATRTTLAQIDGTYRGRCTMMVENGVELSRFVPQPWPDAPGASQALQVLFVGRLIPVKSLDLLLRAVAALRAGGTDVRLTVVGDGPMRADWERLTIDLSLESCVGFTGSQSLQEVAGHMQRCHVFCLPSIRESGGAVLLEAMACARPAIAMDFGGPSELVDDEVGRLISLTTPEAAVNDIAAALRDVLDRPDAWRQRGIAGRLRVETLHGWPAKIATASRIYDEIILEHAK